MKGPKFFILSKAKGAKKKKKNKKTKYRKIYSDFSKNLWEFFPISPKNLKDFPPLFTIDSPCFLWEKKWKKTILRREKEKMEKGAPPLPKKKILGGPKSQNFLLLGFLKKKGGPDKFSNLNFARRPLIYLGKLGGFPLIAR